MSPSDPPAFRDAALTRRHLLLAALLGPRLGASLLRAETGRSPAGFAVPQPDRVFGFPRDHGSHPEFQLEWWYLTGHLRRAEGGELGFQATFFRHAGPEPGVPEEGDRFGTAPLYLAHMAITDPDRRRFLFQERLNRSGWDARASTRTLDVANGNWSLRRLDGDTDRFRLRGSVRGEVGIDLVLEPRKPLVVFGDRGVSRKADDPDAASHYLTFSRLALTGTFRDGERSQAVEGRAWMDHEFSSSQLGRDQVGWDWASLQLEDGRDVMVYRMRRTDGSTDRHSTVAWIGSDGRLTQAGPERFEWEPGPAWTSPATGGKYPIRPRIRLTDPDTGRPVAYHLEPLLDAQEIDGRLGGIPYWEGACRVLDDAGTVVGRAYLELTGYARPVSDPVRGSPLARRAGAR